MGKRRQNECYQIDCVDVARTSRGKIPQERNIQETRIGTPTATTVHNNDRKTSKRESWSLFARFNCGSTQRRTTREEEYRCELNTSSISSIEEKEKENPKQVRERGVYIYVPILPKCYCHLNNFIFSLHIFIEHYKVLTDNPTEDHSRFVAAISTTVRTT